MGDQRPALCPADPSPDILSERGGTIWFLPLLLIKPGRMFDELLLWVDTVEKLFGPRDRSQPVEINSSVCVSSKSVCVLLAILSSDSMTTLEKWPIRSFSTVSVISGQQHRGFNVGCGRRAVLYVLSMNARILAIYQISC